MAIVARPANPKGALIRSAAWALTSIVFVIVSGSQIERVRHARVQVPMLQYAMLCFWILMIPLWLFQAWKSWAHLRSVEKVL